MSTADSDPTNGSSPYADCFGADNPWQSLAPLPESDPGTAAVAIASGQEPIFGELVARDGVLISPSLSLEAAADPAWFPSVMLLSEGSLSLQPGYYTSGYELFIGENLASALSGDPILTWASASTGPCSEAPHAVSAGRFPAIDSVLAITYSSESSRTFAWSVARTP